MRSVQAGAGVVARKVPWVSAVPWGGVAAVCALSAWAVRRFLPPDDSLVSLVFGLYEGGFLSLGFALLALLGLLPRWMNLLGLATWVTVVFLALGEIAFRTMDWDFRRQEEAWRRLPPFLREARMPTGSVFFRRDGPEVWTGAVIRTSLERQGIPVPEVYRDEPSIVARYDAEGFRNETDGTDWDLAVAGDSFTELGFLSFEALFTTILGRELGRKVRNLGVSGTGPYTQLHYLEEFGRSPRLRQVLVVFFEGNDLDDLQQEIAAMNRFEATGERPRRDVVRQTSMLAAMTDVWHGVFSARGASMPLPRVDTFRSAEGDVPVHLTEVPLPRRRLPEHAMDQLDRFLAEYQAWARGGNVEAWLAFMPCKARVLHPRIHGEDPRRRNRGPWWSEELPEQVAAACRRQGIEWVDLTPALMEASRDRGELVFNPLFEAHLNARGSRVVARELVRRFRAHGVASPSP